MNNYLEAGNWYHARWHRDDGENRSPGIFIVVSVLWKVNEWTAEQAAGFAVGLIRREQLPRRRIPVKISKVKNTCGRVVDVRTDETVEY